MPNSFSSTRVSFIYWDVLRRQVNRYCPSLYPRAECISSNYSAERLVHIKQPMLVGINSIRQSLNRIGIKLPEDIADIIMYSETPRKTCEKFRKQIARKGITCEEKGDILFKAIVAVHEQRIKEDNINGKSFTSINPFLQFLFLPAEIIGFDNVKEDYDFIKEAAEILGLRPSDFYVEQAYKLGREAFYEEYAIYPPYMDTVERAIFCFQSANPAIAESIESDKALRARIVKNVLVYQ